MFNLAELRVPLHYIFFATTDAFRVGNAVQKVVAKLVAESDIYAPF